MQPELIASRETAVFEPDRDSTRRAARQSWDEIRIIRRRQLRTCVILFCATLFSTFLVGSHYAPVNYIAVMSSQDSLDQLERAILQQALLTGIPPVTVDEYFQEQFLGGLQYAIPLMIILLSHEMGHYLVAVRYRVPASLPYFIPLPLPPLGTMGAVILQGRGAANRVQMFDIAVCGPLAGLFVTLPVLCYGIYTSSYGEVLPNQSNMEFGEPLILQWMIQGMHGPKPPGQEFLLNYYAMAGWVGIFITALNLLPVGQLDGGHILYTLVGRWAHLVAWGVIVGGCAAMWYTGTLSYILILVLLLLTGVRHPPTANDSIKLGAGRQIVGWLTMAFLIIGFTPQPIMVSQPNPQADREQQPANPPELVFDQRDFSGETASEKFSETVAAPPGLLRQCHRQRLAFSESPAQVLLRRTTSAFQQVASGVGRCSVASTHRGADGVERNPAETTDTLG